jgi:hypothetical protein
LILQLSVSFLYSLSWHFNWYDVELFSNHVSLEFEIPPVHGCLYHYIDLGNFLLWLHWICLSFLFQLFLPFVHFPESLPVVIRVYIFNLWLSSILSSISVFFSSPWSCLLTLISSVFWGFNSKISTFFHNFYFLTEFLILFADLSHIGFGMIS